MTYTPALDWGTYNGQKRIFGPFPITLNEPDADDLYPTVDQGEGSLIFCSDRQGGVFNIFSSAFNPALNLYEVLLDSSDRSEVEIMESLSSSANDKCPFINENFLVFTSDREGGSGGYDLYYSIQEDGQWGTPVNFGSKINSPQDDYRPITFAVGQMGVMLFSSNRPGGEGGFDLYAVQIPDLIQYIW
jgi:hypothetical protein